MRRPLKPLDLIGLYHETCRQQGWKPDQAQVHVVQRLQYFHESIMSTFSFLRVLRKQNHQGIYLWGPVGRGKTILMDLIYKASPLPKKRFHFHTFMTIFHRTRNGLPGPVKHPNALVVDQMLEGVKLLCFDEFQVTNIADAMMLKKIFQILENRGVFFILTSNTPPANLYFNGLNRELFLECIDWLQKNTEVCALDGPIDYRRSSPMTTQEAWGAFLQPHTPHIRDSLVTLFQRITKRDPSTTNQSITLPSQRLPCLGATEEVIYVTFSELCQKPLGVLDYLALAQNHNILILQHIPFFKKEDLSALYRWMTLIDIWYDQNKIFIASGDASYTHIMDPGLLVPAEWERTLSRLHHLNQQACAFMENLA